MVVVGSLQTAVEPVHHGFSRCRSHRPQRKGRPLELCCGEALFSPILCSALSSYFNKHLLGIYYIKHSCTHDRNSKKQATISALAAVTFQ